MASIVWSHLWRLRGLSFFFFSSSDLFNLIFIFLLGLFIWHTVGGDLSFWSSGWTGACLFSGCSSLSLCVSLALYHTILYAPGCLSQPKKSFHFDFP